MIGPTVRERVRWSDVDMMGVVLYAKYLRFMEAAESELFRTIGWPYGRIADEAGVWIARVRVEVDYRRPARLDDEVDTHAEIVKLGGASIQLRFPMTRSDGVRLADGMLVLACLDRERLTSVRMPQALRSALSAPSDA